MAGSPGMLLVMCGVAEDIGQKVEKAMAHMQTNGANQLQLADKASNW